MEDTNRLIALIDEFTGLGHELPHVEFKVNNWEPDRVGTLVSAISNAVRAIDENCGYVICKIWYSISQTVSDLGNIHDRSIRAFAVKPRAFGAPLSGFGA
jgi:hypothetical protein